MTGGDARLHDSSVLDEIELYGELVIAATDSEGPLPPDTIDRILGLPGAPARSAEVRRAG